MTRHDEECLDDILDAVNAIDEYTVSDGLQPGLIYDACRVRLMEIGDAINYLDPVRRQTSRGVDVCIGPGEI